jgi:TonB family protein
MGALLISHAAQIASAPKTFSVSARHSAPAPVQLCRTQDYLFLSWLVAITATFLTVGVVGMFEKEALMPILLSGTVGESGDEKAAIQAAMVDLQTDEQVSQETVQETSPEVLEVPPPIQVLDQPLDLPELAEALVTEDVFVIPTPPKIETALRPQEPAPPKPKPKPAATPTQSRMTARSTTGAAGSVSARGGTGGTGSSGTSNLRGTFNIPRPSYPSSLKSMGVQGTVRLSITVGSSGRAESVSVIGSSGNSSLDQFAASWVRRNGRGPSGLSGTFIAPLTFVIR